MSERKLLSTVVPAVWAGLTMVVLGCGDNGTKSMPNSRFGQIGEVRITVVAPLFFGEGEGELQQVLTWSSTGAWQLREAISYRGLPGDEELKRNQGNPGTYASAYAALITQLNEAPGLKLFIPELSQDLDPECPRGQTRVAVLIRDQLREESASWSRCATGNLSNLSLTAAGPDAAAGRVVQAAILVTEFTQGTAFRSAYFGSLPFGTLEKSEDSRAGLTRPLCFIEGAQAACQPPGQFSPVWRAHKGDPSAEPPAVDWENEMVLVAAVGKRFEAGDSVEVRRVLRTGDGTQVDLFERIPGDFCSPAAREHYPVHIVVAPRTERPIRFSEVVTERVPCGG